MAHAQIPESDLFRRQVSIGSKWVTPVGGSTLPVINPATEEVVGCIPAAGKAEADAAVAAARAAFEAGSWASAPAALRAKVLRRIAELVTERKPQLALLETVDCGKPVDESEWDLQDVAGCFNYYADQVEAREAAGDKVVDLGMPEFVGRVVKEPLGVVALITPWNYPALMATWKVAPALAAGCSAILKPSELASLTCLKLAEIAAEAGVPPGVFSVLTGNGADVGAALASHPNVDKVAFTGSVTTGRAVMRAAAEDVKAVGLELGGKSPIVVFDDCNLEQAVEWAMFGVFWTNGQICSSTSRLLLQEGIAPLFLARLKEEIEKVVICDPAQKESRLGPVVSAAQYAKVLAYVEGAQQEGATLLTGGRRPPHLPRGYYLEPTVFVDVREDSRLWQEEVFGPVLAVRTFRSEAEALAAANKSEFGLAAAVLTSDAARHERMARAFRCGIVWVNCSQLPWGGLKRSGFGRDLGENAMDNYTNVKQIVTYVAKENFGWYPSFKAKM